MTILSRYLPQDTTFFPRRKQRAQSGRRLLVRRRARARRRPPGKPGAPDAPGPAALPVRQPLEPERLGRAGGFQLDGDHQQHHQPLRQWPAPSRLRPGHTGQQPPLRHPDQRRARQHPAEGPRRGRRLPIRERPEGCADPRQRGARGGQPERASCWPGEPGRLAPDRLGRGQQRRVRVLQRLAAERELRRPMARGPGVRLGHEDEHLPHPGLDLDRRRRPGDPPRSGPARRGPAGQPGGARRHQSRNPDHAPEQGHPRPVHLSRFPRRRLGHERGRATSDGRAAPPEGGRRHLDAQPRVAGHRPGHERLRRDRRGQRQ